MVDMGGQSSSLCQNQFEGKHSRLKSFMAVVSNQVLGKILGLDAAVTLHCFTILSYILYLPLVIVVE